MRPEPAALLWGARRAAGLIRDFVATDRLASLVDLVTDLLDEP